MSYDLSLSTPTNGAGAPALLAWFSSRPHYTVTDELARYSNEQTGVHFTFDLRPERDQIRVSFSLNCARPRVFGLEAEPEVRALIESFELVVDDPQEVMGNGLYSRDGFLEGWARSNAFGCSAHVDLGMPLFTLPRSEIEEAWAWNFALEDLVAAEPNGFVPTIRFAEIEGRVTRYVVWGDAMPILLPRVDMIVMCRRGLIGRGANDPMERFAMPYAEAVLHLNAFERGSDRRFASHHRVIHAEPSSELVALFLSRPAEQSLAIDGHVLGLDEVLDDDLVGPGVGGGPYTVTTLRAGQSDTIETRSYTVSKLTPGELLPLLSETSDPRPPE